MLAVISFPLFYMSYLNTKLKGGFEATNLGMFNQLLAITTFAFGAVELYINLIYLTNYPHTGKINACLLVISLCVHLMVFCIHDMILVVDSDWEVLEKLKSVF